MQRMNESGMQQVTTTILDNDEAAPVVPEVTLSVDNAEIAEAAGVAALVRDFYPEWSYSQVADKLLSSVDPVVALVSAKRIVTRTAGNAPIVAVQVRLIDIEPSKEALIFHIGQNQGRPGEAAGEHSNRKHVAPLVLVVLAGGRQFAQVICAAGTIGGFPRRLNGRQQHGRQHADDGNHHQQLDEGEPSRTRMMHSETSRKEKNEIKNDDY